MKALVIGAGAVGTKVAQQLLASNSVDQIVLRDISPEKLGTASKTLSGRVEVEHFPFSQNMDADVVVVASPRGTQLEAVKNSIRLSRPTVVVSDGLAETISILKLEEEAFNLKVPVVVGTGFAPGLSCVLAAYGETMLDEIEEIHVSTGAEADFRSEIKVTDLKVTTSTSGTVYLKTEAKSVDLGATTSGRIKIQGTTEEIDVSASTGGSIDAMDLTANDAYARANTGADIRLNAEERLRASAGTGGSVRYSGKPRTDVRTNTGGSVRRGG